MTYTQIACGLIYELAIWQQHGFVFTRLCSVDQRLRCALGSKYVINKILLHILPASFVLKTVGARPARLVLKHGVTSQVSGAAVWVASVVTRGALVVRVGANPDGRPYCCVHKA